MIHFIIHLSKTLKNCQRMIESFTSDWFLKVLILHILQKRFEVMKLRNFEKYHPKATFNQKIKLSLYEKYSFINKDDISLIDYEAFFGSIKCFKFLMLNGSDLNNSAKYAVAGGNFEIVKLSEQNHSLFEESYEIAVRFHRNEIFHYIYDNKMEVLEDVKLSKLVNICVSSSNYELISILEGKGMKIKEIIINEASKIGNLFLVRHFLENNQFPKNILVFASKSGNAELIKFILEQKGINVNAKDDVYLDNLKF